MNILTQEIEKENYYMTNLERIQQMEVEELAEFLNEIHEPDEDEIMIDGEHFSSEDEIVRWLLEEEGK
jgi:hypothetical protein